MFFYFAILLLNFQVRIYTISVFKKQFCKKNYYSFVGNKISRSFIQGYLQIKMRSQVLPVTFAISPQKYFRQ